METRKASAAVASKRVGDSNAMPEIPKVKPNRSYKKRIEESDEELSSEEEEIIEKKDKSSKKKVKWFDESE